MDAVEALELAYEQTAKLAAGLDAEGLAAESPCQGWDVRTTLNHLLGMVRMCTLVNRGQGADEDGGDLIGDDPSAAVVAATSANLDSWRQPGAFGGQCAYPFGTFPAPAAAMVNLEEVVVHNWDLAKGLGQPFELSSDVVEMVDQFCRGIPLDEFRAHGAFGLEISVPVSSSTTDRLVALLGRNP